jgi:tetratricopeptide (TPR) repeat protein
MKKTGFLALTVLAVAGPEAVSAQDRLASVARAMPTRYIEATCDLRAGHFKVSSAGTYLAVASGGNRNIEGTSDPEKVKTQLDNGIRVVTEAITQNGQGSNPAAWYFLGRLHLQYGDVRGADSAFTKAQELAPACAEDIRSWRQRAWLPMMTPASEYVQQGKADSAMILFKQASTIAPGMPQGYYNIGVLFANAGQADSAIVYFKRSQEAASGNASYAKDRNSATFNLAAMYQRTNQHAQAVTELRKYIEWEPADNDARRALATSLRATGQATEATEVERQALAAAEAAGTLSTSDMMTAGVNLFNDKKYPEAAAAFAKIVAAEPNNRDAQYNLANTYLALDDGPKLIEASLPLVAREPLNEDNRKLLAQGYRKANNQDKLIEVVTELLAMPTSVTVERFQTRASGATLAGHALGRQAERDGNRVPATAKTMVVEFLDAQGGEVTTKEVAIPALEPAIKFDWTTEAEGAGIVAWRYTAK